MRRAGAFWGLLLIVVGGLFLLNTMGLLSVDMWKVLWPTFLILLGVWVLVGGVSARRTHSSAPGEQVTIPLEGAQRARVRMKHGAGRLYVKGKAAPGDLLAGTFGMGLGYDARREGATLNVEMNPSGDFWGRIFAPWQWWQQGPIDWSFALNGDVPMELALETGAGETRLDLTELRVTDLDLQTGMSSTEVTLPARAGHTRARIRSGMAEVKLFVPQGVAARIHATGGLSDISVDRDRFPLSGGAYQSPDFDTAEHKIEIDAETGMGALKIM